MKEFLVRASVMLSVVVLGAIICGADFGLTPWEGGSHIEASRGCGGPERSWEARPEKKPDAPDAPAAHKTERHKPEQPKAFMSESVAAEAAIVAQRVHEPNTFPGPAERAVPKPERPTHHGPDADPAPEPDRDQPAEPPPTTVGDVADELSADVELQADVQGAGLIT